MRWPDGVVTCPTCGRTDVSYLAESAPLAVQEQAPQAPVLGQGRNHLRGLAHRSRQVARRDVAARQRQERHQLLRAGARARRHSDNRVVHAPAHPLGDAGRRFTKLDGTVEVDETFIGGKARFMHRDRQRAAAVNGRRPSARSPSWACWTGTGRTVTAPSAPASFLTSAGATLGAQVRENVAARRSGNYRRLGRLQRP